MDELQLLTMNPPHPTEPVARLITKEKFRGFTYYITFFMHHPCAYVKIPKDNRFFGVDYREIDLGESSPHGDLTFSDSHLHKEYSVAKGWFIGWDYAHFDDYNYRIKTGMLWSIDEIRTECREVIKGIIRKQNEESDRVSL